METVPMIHPNGSAKATLIEDQLSVMRALENACHAMRHAGPHPRDYYYVPGRYEIARKEYDALIEKVQSALTEISEYAEKIDRL